MRSWPAGTRWFEARDGVEEEERITDGCVVNSEKGKRRKKAQDAGLDIQSITREREPV